MDKNIKKIIDDVKEVWNTKQNHLIESYKLNPAGGYARQFSEKLTEAVLETIISGIKKYLNIVNLRSVVGGKDFLNISIKHGGDEIICNNIQVDRHLFLNKRRLAFIENKTYLDACYYDRALADFKKIIYSLKQENDVNNNINNLKFIIFSGQNAINDNKQKFLELFFQYEMNMMGVKKIETKIFYFLNQKKRSSSIPVYMNKFTIDEEVIKEFIYYLLSGIQ